MDDLLRDFLTESAENLGKLDHDIVELERRPGDASLLNGVFRTIHTIKGTCGFLGLDRLEGVAHAAENVLDALRDGKLTATPALIGDILKAVDCIQMILDHLNQHECEPEGSDAALIGVLECLLDPQRTSPGTEQTETIEYSRRKDDGEPAHAHQDSTLRVGVELLDQLMNLVGELALGRNQLLQLISAHEDSEFANPAHQINRITTDLLEAVMKTRMQPIGNAWTKLPRVVRDLSAANGKQISLVMHGAETELDRQILQAIQDPLTHMIRNSADHGIEKPSVRINAGKRAEGTISLSAKHEGGHVVIEIADDGVGIDVGRVRQKAVERGLAKADAVAAMPDAQVLRFVFEPGFSTAAQVTNVSGRGVGMDVVRSNIELIGGTVDLSSMAGQGTTVRVKIPLTLAIISALLVGAGGETFAVPQIGVVEVVGVTEERHALIETVNGAQFYRLRDSLLPLVPLHSLLGLQAMESDAGYNIVVCQIGSLRYGLVVQEVFDTQEIVVKRVGRLARHLQTYAGCTITGDGCVIMILDNAGIAAAARVSNIETLHDVNDSAGSSLNGPTDAAMESFILFDAGYPALQAVPLSLVARLEEFPQAVIEEANGHFLVQYRGDLIPIIAANPAIDMRAIDPRPVIVFSANGRTVGVAVNEIRDIVDEHIQLQRRAPRPGVSGVCVIAGRATEMIDPSYYLHKEHGIDVQGADSRPEFALDEYLAKLDSATALTTVRTLLETMQEAA